MPDPDKSVELENAIIRVESNVNALTDKMSDMSSAVQTMSHAVSKLAVTNVKVDRLEKDIQNIGEYSRKNIDHLDEKVDKLYGKMDALSVDHTQACIERVDDLGVKTEERGVSRFNLMLWMVFGSLGFLVMLAGVFGSIFQNNIGSMDKKIDKLLANDNQIKIKLQDHDGKFSVMEEKLKNVNGHRYYIKKDVEKVIKKK